MSCVFCEIAARRAPSKVVLDHPDAFAFLDVAPVFPGHVLVVPPSHVTTLPELPVDAIGPFFSQVQRIAAVMPAALGCDGTWVSMNNVISQSVAHLHVHVVPRRRKDGLRGFYWPRTRYEAGAAEPLAEALRLALTERF